MCTSGIDLGDVPQPQPEGEQCMARRQRRIVVIGAPVAGAAAVGRQRDDDVAEARARKRNAPSRTSGSSAGAPQAATDARFDASPRERGRQARDKPRAAATASAPLRQRIEQAPSAFAARFTA